MRPAFLIVSESSLSASPRPHRLLLALMCLYPRAKFFVVSPPPFGVFPIKPTCLSFPPLKSTRTRSAPEQEKLDTYAAQENFDPLLFTPNRLQMLQVLNQLNGDLKRQKISLKAVFIEDLALLPAILEHTALKNLVVDLREFYPALVHSKHFSASLFEHICTHYLPYTQKTLSVNLSIAKLYHQTYPRFKLEHNLVWHSTPFYANLQPSPTNPKQIRLLYHGFLAPERDSHNLLELAKSLKALPLPYHLSIMALCKQPDFFQDFKKRLNALKAQGLPINFLSPVDLQAIIPTSHAFDLGLLTLPNNSLNHLYALPNKFFEYIQSALGILSTPLVEVQALVNQYKIGATSADFSHASFTQLLASLNLTDITGFKQRSSQAAKVLCMERQLHSLAKMIANF